MVAKSKQVMTFTELKEKVAKLNKIKVGKGKEAKLLVDVLGVGVFKTSPGSSYKGVRAKYLEFFERLSENKKYQDLVAKHFIESQVKFVDEEIAEEEEAKAQKKAEKKEGGKKKKKKKETETDTKKPEPETDEISGMTKIKQLKKFVKAKGISVKVKKTMELDAAKKLVREAMGETGGKKKKTTAKKKPTKPKEPIERDKYGFKVGTMNSLFADAISKKGMKMADLKTADWNTKKQTFYDCFKALEKKGIAGKTEDGKLYIVGSRAEPKSTKKEKKKKEKKSKKS
jgi:hypothetical protein